MGLLAWYRGTGADLPWGDPGPAHPGVAMEGYFWRFTDRDRGRAIIALIGVNRSPTGPWATIGLGGHPNGFLRTVAHGGASAAPDRLAAASPPAFAGDAERVRVDLGGDARLDVRIREPRRWSRPALGGSSVFQVVPALNQYWHPWLLGGWAEGTAILGGEEWRLDGWQVYGEKNWGRGGFPPAWWWGQAHGFAEREACVAFAGGVVEVRRAPSGAEAPDPAGRALLRTEVTGLVVRLPDATLIRLGDPAWNPVRAHVTDERWSLRGRGPVWGVEVEARAPLGAAHVLPVPLPSERRNVAGALEQLGGTLQAVVRRRGRVVWAGESPVAGLEHGGLARAAAEARRRGAPHGAADAAPVAG